MRPDMKKVIVTRTKTSGGRSSGTAKASKITDESPTKEGRSRIGYDNKHTDGLYGPIYKFLRSRVGKKWDDVWSEVCENAKDKLGNVLRERVSDQVSKKCEVVDGKVVYADGSARYIWNKFFVHPETGILHENKQKYPRYRRKEPENKIVEMDDMEYYCHDGIWFRVKTANYVPPARYDRAHTVEDQFGNSTGSNLKQVYGVNKYVIWKQQASSREIHKLKELLNGTGN